MEDDLRHPRGDAVIKDRFVEAYALLRLPLSSSASPRFRKTCTTPKAAADRTINVAGLGTGWISITKLSKAVTDAFPCKLMLRNGDVGATTK